MRYIVPNNLWLVAKSAPYLFYITALLLSRSATLGAIESPWCLNPDMKLKSGNKCWVFSFERVSRIRSQVRGMSCCWLQGR